MLVRSYLRLVQFVFFLISLTPILVYGNHLHIQSLRSAAPFSFLTQELVWLYVAAVVSNVCVGFILWKIRPSVESASSAYYEMLGNIPEKRLSLAIAVSAGLGLFLELAVIRWQVSVIPLLAFYKNFGLFACFAGLGLGYAISARKTIPILLVVPLLGLQIFSLLYLKFGFGSDLLADVIANPIKETVNMGVINVRTRMQTATIYFVLSAIFLLTALTFLPLGQLAGTLMTRCSNNLKAYGFNLLGSLIGVLLMHGVSLTWAPPPVWFSAAFAGLLCFMFFSPRTMLISGLFSVIVLAVLSWPFDYKVQQIYSPYQLIEREYSDDGLMHIRAAGHTFQTAHNLAEEYVNKIDNAEITRQARYYELPYEILGEPGSVAIVGAGTGNDVAAALRRGATQVDAVEIDPAVLMLGKQFHPENPYADSRVNPIVNDARSHFRNTDQTYDMIVYGLLDSHSVLSHSSSVRLDSFVYTVEGFREARSRLTDSGVLSLSFFVLTPELGKKIYSMLEEAFDGQAPIILQSTYNNYYLFFESNDGLPKIAPEVLTSAEYDDISAQVAADVSDITNATDDWPFFYMPRKVYPFSYLGVLVMFFGLFVLLFASFSKEKPALDHAIYFFLGAGFMLVETKGITELGLTFGNTWQVIGIVIAGVLVMAYFANLVVAKINLTHLMIPFICLFASLLIGYAVAFGGGLPSTSVGRIGTVLLITCPIFFSGICFSTALGQSKNVAGAMGANLLGAMFGGLLEYNSMRFGFQSLYLLGMILYVLAALSYFLPAKVRVKNA
jgi:spermidine synthase